MSKRTGLYPLLSTFSHYYLLSFSQIHWVTFFAYLTKAGLRPQGQIIHYLYVGIKLSPEPSFARIHVSFGNIL